MSGNLGQAAMIAMTLAGIVGMVRASRARRRARRLGEAAPKPEAVPDGRMEMERRMAAYLASRDNYK